MVKFIVKSNTFGQFYFPKLLRRELGGIIEVITCTKTAVIFPAGMPLKDVLKGLEVIRLDLKNRLELEGRNKR